MQPLAGGSREIAIATAEFTTAKPILAARPRDAQQVSTGVRDNADKIMNWSTESIVAGIGEIAL